MLLADYTSKYRFNLIINSVNSWLISHERVLDVGCGNGVVSKLLEDHFNLKLTGCDVLDYIGKDIRFIHMKDKNVIPFKNNAFDTVFFIDTLHHASKENQKTLLKEAGRVAKKIIIFEVLPTITGKVADYLINQLHNRNMEICFTYRYDNEWRILFNELNYQYNTFFVKKPLLYPFCHIAYKLNVQ